MSSSDERLVLEDVVSLVDGVVQAAKTEECLKLSRFLSRLEASLQSVVLGGFSSTTTVRNVTYVATQLLQINSKDGHALTTGLECVQLALAMITKHFQGDKNNGLDYVCHLIIVLARAALTCRDQDLWLRITSIQFGCLLAAFEEAHLRGQATHVSNSSIEAFKHVCSHVASAANRGLLALHAMPALVNRLARFGDAIPGNCRKYFQPSMMHLINRVAKQIPPEASLQDFQEVLQALLSWLLQSCNDSNARSSESAAMAAQALAFRLATLHMQSNQWSEALELFTSLVDAADYTNPRNNGQCTSPEESEALQHPGSDAIFDSIWTCLGHLKSCWEDFVAVAEQWLQAGGPVASVATRLLQDCVSADRSREVPLHLDES
jgi:hypothetical protein